MEPSNRQAVIQDRHEKAKKLLMNEKAVFDDQHALALCKQYNFKPGILYLYKKQQMFNEIIEYHMAKNEYDELIRACNKYGYPSPPTSPSLSPSPFLSSSSSLFQHFSFSLPFLFLFH